MLWLYRLAFLPALLVLAPRYLWRMRKRGGYAEDFAHRFGRHRTLPPREPGRVRVWLQAVSVGEMLAIAPILEALHRDGAEVYLTTTTSTGHRLARERYAALVVGLGYFPLDWWPFVARAWRAIDPDLVILTEGERWPELLRQAERRRVPVLNVNARLSDRSYGRLRALPGVARAMLRGLTRVLPCSVQDEARFLELGVPRERLTTTGNIKLDVRIAPLTDTERARLRRELGLPADAAVLLGSSTWPGEEAAALAAWQQAKCAGLRCVLLIVPRHAERRGEIERWLVESGGRLATAAAGAVAATRPGTKTDAGADQAAGARAEGVEAGGFRYHLRSRGAAAGEVEVAVADTTGELRALTQLADVVFVGKSLAPHTEGQTPVEAAALGKPILFGPGMGNFRAIARDLLERGAAREVPDAAALAREVAELLADARRRATLAEAAAQWRRDNGGAVERTLRAIREEISRVKK